MREVFMQISVYKKVPVSFCVILFAVLVSLSGTGCKNRLMFHPYRQVVSDPSVSGIVFEDVYFKTEDGIMLNGWWVASRGGRGTVLFCHGNAGNISFLVETIEIFHGMGLNMFVFDYRGFGRSGGVPTEEGTYRDVTAAWDYLIAEKKAPPSQIILVGRSLGGSIAAWLAQHRSPAALVLESTFTRAADVANHHYNFHRGISCLETRTIPSPISPASDVLSWWSIARRMRSFPINWGGCCSREPAALKNFLSSMDLIMAGS
jgi:pimeloyl-ACP methyl ester carboxylesterase